MARRTALRAACPLGRLRHVRRHPGDVLRVVVGGLVVVAGGMAARHGHVFAFDTNLFRLVNELPDGVGWPLLAVMQLGAVAAVPVMAGRELAGVLRRPTKAAQLLGGSAGVTLTYALALAGCLAAFDAHLPLASTIGVYMAGAAVASVSPTPGGLGAMEAALVAGLTAVGAPTGPAVAGVLAFRLLTFWLPILPGGLAYRALRATGTI